MTEKKPRKKAAPKPKKEETAFDKLTDKHKLFVLNYIKNLYNGVRAYMDTYPNAKYDSARSKSCELLAKDNIKKAISEKSIEQFKEIQAETEKEKTYQLIKALGDATVDQVVNWEGNTLVFRSLEDIPEAAKHAISSVSYDRKENKDGISENIKVTFHNKLSALKMRAQIQGLIDSEKENQQIEIIVTPAQRPDKKKTEEDENE